MQKLLTVLLCLLFIACDSGKTKKEDEYKFTKENPKPLEAPSYKMAEFPLLIKNAKVMTATGKIYEKAHILIEGGLIKKISEESFEPPNNTNVIDGTNTVVTPGLIDTHSHMGVYPWPSLAAHSDGNEVVGPVSSHVWAEHGFWPQDPAIWRAMGGGITTIQVLHGSANLIGGRSFTTKLIPQLNGRLMRFKEAPQGMKMACGENPKRVWGSQGRKRGPDTRMGNIAGYRKTYQEAVEYMREWAAFKKKGKGKVPKRNFQLETLAKVLKGEILVHFHCYRADDISNILDVAAEFGFKIRSIHHGLEAYKLKDRLAKEEVSVSTWADWWGFKMEAHDGIPHNAAILEDAGVRAIIHSDSATDIRFLNVEAAKAMMAGRRLGIPITENQALRWVTANPAWALGIDDKVGTLEEGKHADLVIWDGNPFSIYTKARQVIVNGDITFDRQQLRRPKSDVEIGYLGMDFHDGREFTPPKTTPKLTYPILDLKISLEKKEKVKDSFILHGVKSFIDGQWVIRDILVKDGKITKISKDSIKMKGLPVIFGRDHYLTPGLVEVSSSMGLFDIAIDSYTNDSRSGVKKPTPDNWAVDALDMRNSRLPIARSEGVTTVIAHPSGHIIAGHGVAYDTKALKVSRNEKYIKSPVALYGSMSKGRKNSRSMQWRELRQVAFEVISYMKNKSGYLNGNTQKFRMKRNDLEAMVPIFEGKIPWVVEAHRASEIEALIAFKERLNNKNINIRFVLSGATEAWVVAKQIAKHKIPVMMTPSSQVPSSFSSMYARFDAAARLQKAGVSLIITTAGARDDFERRLRQEAGFAVKYGLPQSEAIKAITETPAKVFGLQRGSIKENQVANLVLWSGDPLEPSSWVDTLWMTGWRKSLETRQSLLAKKYYQIKFEGNPHN